ncbi:MAG: dihydroorotate dehydrogenase electron transfer subunit [Ignavibacteriales bacterium]
MSKHIVGKITGKQYISDDIFKYTFESADIAKNAVPGQFVDIKCSEGINTILRRPISISNTIPELDSVEFIMQVRGNATSVFSKSKPGDDIDVIGPLGKGFTINPNVKKPILLGGGIGIFPMYFLGKKINNHQTKIVLGFRNKDLVIMEDEFASLPCSLYITTDDGSYGQKGFVTDVLESEIKASNVDMIYACGPLPMLKRVKDISAKAGIPCELSVEERMGCGVGACLGCAIKLVDGQDWRFGHVCKDGPVFKAEEIIFE